MCTAQQTFYCCACNIHIDIPSTAHNVTVHVCLVRNHSIALQQGVQSEEGNEHAPRAARKVYLNRGASRSQGGLRQCEDVQGAIMTDEGCLARVVRAPSNMPHCLLAPHCGH